MLVATSTAITHVVARPNVLIGGYSCVTRWVYSEVGISINLDRRELGKSLPTLRRSDTISDRPSTEKMALGRLYLGGQCDCELHHNTTMHIIAIDASQSFQSLADRTRLRIARLLAASGLWRAW